MTKKENETPVMRTVDPDLKRVQRIFDLAQKRAADGMFTHAASPVDSLDQQPAMVIARRVPGYLAGQAAAKLLRKNPTAEDILDAIVYAALELVSRQVK